MLTAGPRPQRPPVTGKRALASALSSPLPAATTLSTPPPLRPPRPEQASWARNLSRFPLLGMATVSGRGLPTRPGPRAMSWAGEPAPGAARQLRPAQRPSRTGVHSSREDLGWSPASRWQPTPHSETNHRLGCRERHHPAPTDHLPRGSVGIGLCLGCCCSGSVGFRCTSCEVIGVSDVERTPALTRTEFTPWSPRFFSCRLCPRSRFTSAPKCPYVVAFVLAIMSL